MSPSAAETRAVAALRAHIERGAHEHYDDALYYDHVYKRRREDVNFYVQMAKQWGGPILELGVGTGRVAAAIAAEGIEITGVDAHPAMLQQAEARQKGLPLAKRKLMRLKLGDIRELRLRRRFRLVIAPFNVLMHLYDHDDLHRALRSAHRHLEARGRFAFDVLMPDLRSFLRAPERRYRCRDIFVPALGRRYAYYESFRYDSVRQIQIVRMDFVSEDHAFTRYLSQRQFFPQELEAACHRARFRLEERWGDFAGSPPDIDSPSQVLVLGVER